MKALTMLTLSCLLCAAANSGTEAEEQAVRELITRRNIAYHNLDAKALASLLTPDFRLVDRLGDNYRSQGPEYNTRMWDWGFKYVYRGRREPEHRILNIEFIAPTVALVQTAADWEEIVLDNGQKIPPHGKVDTFIVVKRGEEWRIKMQTIHNQAADRIGDDFNFHGEPKGPPGGRVRPSH